MDAVSAVVQQEYVAAVAKHGAGDNEVDESMISYLVEMLRSIDESATLDDVTSFLQQLVGGDDGDGFPDDAAEALSLSLFKAVHGHAFGENRVPETTPQRELEAPMCAADVMGGIGQDDASGDAMPSHDSESANPLATSRNAPIAEGGAGGEKKQSKAALARAARRAEKQAKHKLRIAQKADAELQSESQAATGPTKGQQGKCVGQLGSVVVSQPAQLKLRELGRTCCKYRSCLESSKPRAFGTDAFATLGLVDCRNARTTDDAQTPGTQGEGDHVWSTKRFERFHKTWTGHSQWKVRGDAAALQIDELDDDDYSSAWLECLKLGIPWGGEFC
jgi:hypothetical protein